MSIFRRLSTTLFSRIDQVVGEIENHDALIKAAIGEQRKKVAAAKVQLSRVRGNEKELREQIAQLNINQKRWAARAVGAADDDEEKALACMQRRQSALEQIEKLRRMEKEYHQTAEKMAADIARSEEELRGMEQKHQLMRARQTSVDALNVINHTGESTLEELDTSFERWEIKLAQGEFTVGALEEVDELEQAYLSEENRENLRLELNALLNKEKEDEQ